MPRPSAPLGLGAAVLLATAAPALGIGGGRPATAAEFPTAVNLMNALGCSGTLISPTRIAIAAHCTPVLTPGCATVTIAGTRHTVTRVAVHPRFAFRQAFGAGRPGRPGSGAYDVGVAEISPPVTAVAPTPIAAADPVPGTPVVEVGFGASRERGKPDGMMRAADMVAVGDAECAAANAATRRNPAPAYVAAANVCARDADAHAPFASGCHGDSGGPLYARRPDGVLELAGVASWSLRCGGSRPTTTVFASAATYAAFLTSPNVPWLPALKAPVAVRGAARVGATLRCETRWRVPPRVTRTAWVVATRAQLRRMATDPQADEQPPPAGVGAVYRPQAADAGKLAVCVVVTNGAPGLALFAVSAPRTIRATARARTVAVTIPVVG